MGGKTSSASKSKWRSKAKDQINITVPKGEKEIFQAFAAERGLSLNQLFYQTVKDRMEKEKNAKDGVDS